MNLRFTLAKTTAIASLLFACVHAMAASLDIDVNGKRTLSTEQLLARDDAVTVHVPNDVSFHRAMSYRAVPLRALLGVSRLPADTELEITGTDGFVTHLPAKLVFGRAQAWLAIEPPDAPWPRTGDGGDIGPFYLVWTDAGASKIESEQWPYKVDAIRTTRPAAVKWPQIAVGNEVAAHSPVREGQRVFATQCMACHKMNGAGDASMGPDLNLPHNPTEYFQPWALKQFIRDPRSLRAWPDMKMHGFGPDAMSDTDLDRVIAYLAYMAKRRK
jgi:mono/diheme cytochrome c family protein